MATIIIINLLSDRLPGLAKSSPLNLVEHTAIIELREKSLFFVVFFNQPLLKNLFKSFKFALRVANGIYRSQ